MHKHRLERVRGWSTTLELRGLITVKHINKTHRTSQCQLAMGRSSLPVGAGRRRPGTEERAELPAEAGGRDLVDTAHGLSGRPDRVN